MNVTILSAFRNASRFIDRYADQVAQLGRALATRGDGLYCVWAEGDSTDGSRAQLTDALDRVGVPGVIIDASHGGPVFGSVVHPLRFKQLATVGTKLFRQIPAGADVVLFAEPDLIWATATVVALIDYLAELPAVAPMVYLNRAGWPAHAFYDIWAFRLNGQRFGHLPPYVDELAPAFGGGPPAEPIRVDSAGSMLAMRAGLARGQIMPDDVIVGLCRQIESRGGSIWLIPDLAVYHE